MHATDEGTVEFKLAAQHYEMDAGEEVDSGNHTKSTNESQPPEPAVGGESPATEVPLVESGRRRRSSAPGLEDDELRIDMERLVPISAETFAETVITLGDNYHFVMTGRTWALLPQSVPKSTLDRILAKGTVYARMSPECKRQLVESLQVRT